MDNKSARNTIIEAAAIAFVENGYQATTLDDIAQAAGVARRTIYLHFKSKKDILVAACIEQAHRFLEEVKHNVPDNDDFPIFMLDCLNYVIEKSPQSTLFMFKVSEEAGLDPVALYFQNQQFIDDWVNFFQQPYTRAVEKKQLNPDMQLVKLVNWFGRISTSYLQHPLKNESTTEIRESNKVFFLSALRYNSYHAL